MVYARKSFFSNYGEWLEEYNKLSLDDREKEGDKLIESVFKIINKDKKKLLMTLLLTPIIATCEERKLDPNLTFRQKLTLKYQLIKLNNMKNKLDKEMNKIKEYILSKGDNSDKHTQAKK